VVARAKHPPWRDLENPISPSSASEGVCLNEKGYSGSPLRAGEVKKGHHPRLYPPPSRGGIHFYRKIEALNFMTPSSPGAG